MSTLAEKPAKYLIGYYSSWEFVVVATYCNKAMNLERSVFIKAAADLCAVISKASGDKSICMLLED